METRIVNLGKVGTTKGTIRVDWDEVERSFNKNPPGVVDSNMIYGDGTDWCFVVEYVAKLNCDQVITDWLMKDALVVN